MFSFSQFFFLSVIVFAWSIHVAVLSIVPWFTTFDTSTGCWHTAESYNDDCYFVVSTGRQTWDAAKQFCGLNGGVLLHWADRQELLFFLFEANSLSLGDAVWTGLQRTNGYWSWFDHATVPSESDLQYLVPGFADYQNLIDNTTDRYVYLQYVNTSYQFTSVLGNSSTSTPSYAGCRKRQVGQTYVDAVVYFPLDHTLISGLQNYVSNVVSTFSFAYTNAESVRYYDERKGNSIGTVAGHDSSMNLGNYAGSCLSNPSLCTTGFTLAFWFKFLETPISNSTEYYMDTGGKDGYYGLAIYYANGSVIFKVKDNLWTSRVSVRLGLDIFIHQWIHVIMIFDKNATGSGSREVTIYINSTQLASVSESWQLDAVQSEVPQDLSTTFFVGLDGAVIYDEIAFWDKVLNASQRESIYEDNEFANSGVTVNISDYPDVWSQDAVSTTAIEITTDSEITSATLTTKESMISTTTVADQSTATGETSDIPSTMNQFQETTSVTTARASTTYGTPTESNPVPNSPATSGESTVSLDTTTQKLTTTEASTTDQVTTANGKTTISALMNKATTAMTDPSSDDPTTHKSTTSNLKLTTNERFITMRESITQEAASDDPTTHESMTTNGKLTTSEGLTTVRELITQEAATNQQTTQDETTASEATTSAATTESKPEDNSRTTTYTVPTTSDDDSMTTRLPTTQAATVSVTNTASSSTPTPSNNKVTIPESESTTTDPIEEATISGTTIMILATSDEEAMTSKLSTNQETPGTTIISLTGSSEESVTMNFQDSSSDTAPDGLTSSSVTNPDVSTTTQAMAQPASGSPSPDEPLTTSDGAMTGALSTSGETTTNIVTGSSTELLTMDYQSSRSDTIPDGLTSLPVTKPQHYSPFTALTSSSPFIPDQPTTTSNDWQTVTTSAADSEISTNSDIAVPMEAAISTSPDDAVPSASEAEHTPTQNTASPPRTFKINLAVLQTASPQLLTSQPRDASSQIATNLWNLVNTTLSDGNTDSHTAALLFNSTATLADYSTEDKGDSSLLVTSAEVYVELASVLVKSFSNYTVEEAKDVVAASLNVVNNLVSPANAEKWTNVGSSLVAQITQTAELMAVNLAERAGNASTESIVLESEHLVTVIDFLHQTESPEGYTFPGEASNQEGAAFEIPATVLEMNGAQAIVTLLYHSLGPLMQEGAGSEGDEKQEDIQEEGDSQPQNVTADSVVGSKVLSVTLVPPLQRSQKDAIKFGFHLDPDSWSSLRNGKKEKMCSFWNFSLSNETNGAWSDSGCHLTWENETFAECSCDHMTSFAVLIQVVDTEISEIDEKALDLISLIGCVFSITGTFLMCSTYLFLRMTSERTLIHFNLALAIMMAQIAFLFEDSIEKETIACTVLTVLLYYFNTATFCWMLIEGVQIYFQVVVVFVHAERLKLYVLIGWGLPLIFTIITTAILRESLGMHGVCWLSREDNSIWFFVVPVIIVILINCYILVRVTKVIVSLTKAQGGSKFDNAKKSVKASFMLLPLLGSTWVFGFLCVTGSTIVFHYLFAICNSFQGFYLFLTYCAFSTEVRDSWRKKRESWSLSRSLNTRRSSKVSPITVTPAWEDKPSSSIKWSYSQNTDQR